MTTCSKLWKKSQTDYLTELKEELKKVKDLDTVKGPMRDGPVGSIHTDVFSTHPEVMIENSHSENTTIRYAEPMSTLAWKFGLAKYPATYLEKIWKLLFQSHAHDSMHGLFPNGRGLPIFDFRTQNIRKIRGFKCSAVV